MPVPSWSLSTFSPNGVALVKWLHQVSFKIDLSFIMPDSVMLFFKITEIEELSSQKSDVVFVKVDVDENEEAAAVR